jgi:ABC-type branched-subunit amino acid transport system permease subunit
VTLGFGEIIRLLLNNLTSLTGGPDGISGIPKPTVFGSNGAQRQRGRGEDLPRADRAGIYRPAHGDLPVPDRCCWWASRCS